VRIIAGRWRGRTIRAPRDARVRPTGDRAREAWMMILHDELPGAKVLDLYAGSGALGFEALSRGAASVDFVELAPAGLRALRENGAALGALEQIRIHRAEALRYAQRLSAGEFDVAFADPPYRTDAADRLVALFRERPFARILSVEHRADRRVEGDQTRRYGDTAVTFCRAP